MIVYNLTDIQSPGKPGQNPQTLVVMGKPVLPGGYVELSDDVNLRKISGWIYSGKISVDYIPRWYKVGRQAKSNAKRIVPPEGIEG